MIKAVIFDWRGVLIENPSNGLIEYLSNYLGVKKENFEKAFETCQMDFTKGLISEEKLWGKICKTLKVDFKKPESLWKNAINAVFKENPQILGLILDLKSKGYKVGLLSNTEKPAVEYFYQKGYEKYFDEVVFSCHEGMAKPEKEIYQKIVGKLNVNVEEAIFIDDIIYNVDGARQIGIGGIHYRNFDQLLREFELFNIKLR